MHVYQAIRTAAKRSGMSLVEIGPSMDPPRGRASVSSMISLGKVPRTDTLCRILSACGYELCAIPKGAQPADAIIIEV